MLIDACLHAVGRHEDLVLTNRHHVGHRCSLEDFLWLLEEVLSTGQVRHADIGALLKPLRDKLVVKLSRDSLEQGQLLQDQVA